MQGLAATLLILALSGCGSGDEDDGAVLIIESEPEDGASIQISGKMYGETPATIRGLPAGQYYAILNQYGYKRTTRSIILPETGEVHIVAQMEPIVGYLTLESDPPLAKVYLDGVRYLGETPLVAKPIPIGRYSYELRLENYLTLQNDVEILEDRRYSFTHRFTPMKAQIQVFSRPSDATIYINDVIQKKTTPTRFSLSPGIYTVGIYKKGYILAEQVLDLGPNEQDAVDLRLEEGEVPPGMILIPAGEFTFGVSGGAPDEAPQRKIDLDAFYIDKLEVTNRQYAQTFPAHIFSARLADYPVRGVSWNQAVEYATAVGKRLPTETEWEKAARGTDGREFPWGDRLDPSLGNVEKGFDARVSRVGHYRGGASPYGVMDMAGNVYEWTYDWYQPYEGNTVITTEYGQVFRVLRGGSYRSELFDVRAARRHYDRMESAREDYGFRCAKDVEELKPKRAP